MKYHRSQEQQNQSVQTVWTFLISPNSVAMKANDSRSDELERLYGTLMSEKTMVTSVRK